VETNNGWCLDISVSVPEGMSGGDVIGVSSPRTGRIISATIPHGLRPGETFIVEYPPQLDQSVSPSIVNVPPVAPTLEQHQYNLSPVPTTVATIVDETNVPYAIQNATVHEGQENPMATTSTSFVNVPSAPTATNRISTPSIANFFPTTPAPSPPQNNPNQKLILVKVPSGVLPGSVIQVPVPGENRMIAAEVPPGVSEFYVAYGPQKQSSVLIMGHSQSFQNSYETNINQGFGTRQNCYGGGMGHRQQQRIGRGQNTTNSSSYRDGYRHNNNRPGFGNNNSGGGGIGYVAPVLTGAALMGTAGYMIHHHNQINNGDFDHDYDDGGGEYDNWGGECDDFGGDEDF